jgi:hypothetical protein
VGLLAQRRFEHLAAGVAGQWVGAHGDVLRDLEVGEALLGEHQQLLRVQFAPRQRDDDGADLLPHHRVRHPDDGDLAHRGMGSQGVLDLHAVHVLAAAIDHVLLAVDDEDEPLDVDACQVAAVQPPVDEGLRRLLGLAPVAGDHVGAADEQLADPRPGVRLGYVEVDDRGGEADRVGVLGGVLVGQVGGDRRGLGQPEPVADAGSRESCLEPVHEVGGDRRAPVAERPHRRGVDVDEVRLRQRQPVDGRHGRQHRDAFVLYGAEEGRHLERRHDH